MSDQIRAVWRDAAINWSKILIIGTKIPSKT